MMLVLANIVIAIVVFLHLGFLVLEMFFWNHPVGKRISILLMQALPGMIGLILTYLAN